MRYNITHLTEYIYQENVSSCYNEARLLPISTSHQTCYKRKLIITPEPNYYQERQDYFGNQSSFFCIHEPHNKMSVTTLSEIEVHQRTMPDLASSLSWENVKDAMRNPLTDDLIRAKEFCLDSPMATVTEQIYDYAKPSFTKGSPFLCCVEHLMSRIYSEFSYDPTFTTITTPLHEVLRHQRGVCQDFAHLAIACIRSMGLPACYISGYLETLPPPGQPRLIGADASHAWFSVYDPNIGWVEFDPTNNKIPLQQYINVAYGRDYIDVTPLKGVLFGGGGHQLKVSVDVAPIENNQAMSQQQQ